MIRYFYHEIEIIRAFFKHLCLATGLANVLSVCPNCW